jgi:hypothetical protein
MPKRPVELPDYEKALADLKLLRKQNKQLKESLTEANEKIEKLENYEDMDSVGMALWAKGLAIIDAPSIIDMDALKEQFGSRLLNDF